MKYSPFAASSGCYKQPGAISRDVKMLKGERWAGLGPGRHFFPVYNIAELVQYIAEKEKLLSILLITNAFGGRKTLMMDKARC